VPTSDVSGEQLSVTQPIPLAPPPLVPQSLKPEDAWGLVYLDRIVCRDRIAGLRSEGLYTPPSLRGTLLFPFSGGGVNWGGGAFDPGRGPLYRQYQSYRTCREADPAGRLCGGARR
jgi:quinoprotein glucose dehydrogenase